MNLRQSNLYARSAILSVIITTCSLSTLGQSPQIKVKPVVQFPAVISPLPESIDESFDLDIAERRITRVNFEASTAVGTNGNAREVNVAVGVSLTAATIEVWLTNVKGHVRIKGTLERISELIRRRSASSNPEPR